MLPLVEVSIDVLGSQLTLASGFSTETSSTFLNLLSKRRLDQRKDIVFFEEGVASQLRHVVKEVRSCSQRD